MEINRGLPALFGFYHQATGVTTMEKRKARSNNTCQVNCTGSERETVMSQERETFSEESIDTPRDVTGYKPRLRVCTASRLLATVIMRFLSGQPLFFVSLRATFVSWFGRIASYPFQKRFKQKGAGRFFEFAFKHVVDYATSGTRIGLSRPLSYFAVVLVFDATNQRVPPHGCGVLPACDVEQAAAKCLVSCSLKTGLIDDTHSDAQPNSDVKFWRWLVPSLVPRTLYLCNLACFEKALFTNAVMDGAHVLIRLKQGAKLQVLGHVCGRVFIDVPGWLLSHYVQTTSRKRSTFYDLDVAWGKGKDRIVLRVVGYAHNNNQVRWYMTTVPRSMLTAQQIGQCYRLRWHIDLVSRELKQSADLGRCFTADRNAVKAVTYTAMMTHVLVRSSRIHAPLVNGVSLERLRPLATLQLVDAYASQIVEASWAPTSNAWEQLARELGEMLLGFAREPCSSRSRHRIALELGATGA